ncbi:hypothetical protein OH146_06020 [Salinibacterium sp. SYSU T00001]|uniref:hypothetical protein n=1 Tax=Homoserinimonas sedimenticola TaxID=2986805 RepID=UPI002235C41D|nr:hypothetical protein [Salinibacterium sedimenticola]MCW4385328.1 hypothetical protein [Salinibacterium sedimenticola]
MSAKDNVVTVGGEPRIDFLPPEIRQKKQTRRTIRGLVMLVIVVIAVCVAGYAATTTLAIASQVNLDIERDRTTELLRQQSEYSEARSVSATVEAAKDARLVASAPEVLWVPYLAAVVQTLPGDGVITNVSIDSVTAIEAPPVPKEGVEAPRTGTIVLTGNFASLSDIAAWLENVESLRGFAGYTISQAQLDEAARYTIELSLHLDEGASELLYFESSAGEGESGEGESADGESGEEVQQ